MREWLDVCVYLCSTILKLTLSVSAMTFPTEMWSVDQDSEGNVLKDIGWKNWSPSNVYTFLHISNHSFLFRYLKYNIRFRFLKKHIIFVQSLPHNWTAKISLFRVFIFHKITALIFCYKSNCLNESSQITFNAAAKFWNIISFTNFIRFTNEACPEQLFCVFFGEQCVS